MIRFDRMLFHTLALEVLTIGMALAPLTGRAEATTDRQFTQQLVELSKLKTEINKTWATGSNQALITAGSVGATALGLVVTVSAAGHLMFGGGEFGPAPLTPRVAVIGSAGVAATGSGGYMTITQGGKLIGTAKQFLELKKRIDAKESEIRRQLASSNVTISDSDRVVAESLLH